jgi:hypothetical protein
MATTRSLWLPDTTLLSWPSTGAYLFDVAAGTVTVVPSYPSTGLPYEIYEVSQILTGPTLGSWWLPTALTGTTPPWSLPQYGGAVPLTTTSSIIPVLIDDLRVVSAATLFFWIPASSLASSGYGPMTWTDTVNGQFPAVAPGGGGGGKYTVVTLPNGVEIDLQSPGWTAKITANKVQVVWNTAPSPGGPRVGR